MPARRPPARTAKGPPDFLAGLLVQGDQRLAFDAGVDEHQVAVKHRRGGGTPSVELGADIGVPELRAGVVEGEYARLDEESVEPFVVGSGGARRVAVFAHRGRLGLLRLDRLGPEDFAVAAIQAQDIVTTNRDLTQAVAAGEFRPSIAWRC